MKSVFDNHLQRQSWQACFKKKNQHSSRCQVFEDTGGHPGGWHNFRLIDCADYCPGDNKNKHLVIGFQKSKNTNDLKFFTGMQAPVVKKQMQPSDSTGLLTLQAQKTL